MVLFFYTLLGNKIVQVNCTWKLNTCICPFLTLILKKNLNLVCMCLMCDLLLVFAGPTLYCISDIATCFPNSIFTVFEISCALVFRVQSSFSISRKWNTECLLCYLIYKITMEKANRELTIMSWHKKLEKCSRTLLLFCLLRFVCGMITRRCLTIIIGYAIVKEMWHISHNFFQISFAYVLQELLQCSDILQAFLIVEVR